MASFTLKRLIQTQVYRIVFRQLASIFVLAVLTEFRYGSGNSLSLFLGGLAYIVPTLLFVWVVFQFVRAQQMLLFVAAFFFGEALKLVVSAVLFLMIAKYLPVTLLFVLIGYISAICLFWVMSFWEFSTQRKNQIEEWLNE